MQVFLIIQVQNADASANDSVQPDMQLKYKIVLGAIKNTKFLYSIAHRQLYALRATIRSVKYHRCKIRSCKYKCNLNTCTDTIYLTGPMNNGIPVHNHGDQELALHKMDFRNFLKTKAINALPNVSFETVERQLCKLRKK